MDLGGFEQDTFCVHSYKAKCSHGFVVVKTMPNCTANVITDTQSSILGMDQKNFLIAVSLLGGWLTFVVLLLLCQCMVVRYRRSVRSRKSDETAGIEDEIYTTPNPATRSRGVTRITLVPPEYENFEDNVNVFCDKGYLELSATGPLHTLRSNSSHPTCDSSTLIRNKSSLFGGPTHTEHEGTSKEPVYAAVQK